MTSSPSSDQSVSSSSTTATASSVQESRYGGPIAASAARSSPALRRVTTVTGRPSVIPSRSTAAAWCSATTWAKVRCRIRHLTPVQASSS